jgi:hypothetical protein
LRARPTLGRRWGSLTRGHSTPSPSANLVGRLWFVPQPHLNGHPVSAQTHSPTYFRLQSWLSLHLVRCRSVPHSHRRHTTRRHRVPRTNFLRVFLTPAHGSFVGTTPEPRHAWRCTPMSKQHVIAIGLLLVAAVGWCYRTPPLVSDRALAVMATGQLRDDGRVSAALQSVHAAQNWSVLLPATCGLLGLGLFAVSLSRWLHSHHQGSS